MKLPTRTYAPKSAVAAVDAATAPGVREVPAKRLGT